MDYRPSPIAGTWYPGEETSLARSIDAFLDAAPPQHSSGRLIGLVAPHAGHRYSGAVAGAAFRMARGLSPEIVAVVSPMHVLAPAAVLTSAHQAYRTPLGDIPVDREAISALQESLAAKAGISLLAIRRDREHSLEIELPFLQRALGGFRLLPVMILDQLEATSEAVGHSLAEVLRGRNALLVASSDLSHHYSAHIANTLDAEMMRRIESFQPEAVMRAEEEGVGFACGRAAIAAVLWAARDLGADRVTVQDYATSGDVTGDESDVVGYGAAAIWQSVPPA